VEVGVFSEVRIQESAARFTLLAAGQARGKRRVRSKGRAANHDRSERDRDKRRLSPEGFEAAVRESLNRANGTLRNLT
jgi:hypothetical protein